MKGGVQMSEWSDDVGMPPLLCASSVRLGFHVERYQHQIPELEQPPFRDDILGMTITWPVGIERKRSRISRPEVHDPGALHVIAAGTDATWRFDHPLDSMHLRMSPAFLLRAFGEDAEGVRLADADMLSDVSTAIALQALLQGVSDAGGWVGLGAEAAAIRIGRRLLDLVPSGRRLRPTRASGLSARELRAVDDYLAEHRGGSVSVADAADRAMLSPFHLMRLFKDTTGTTLYSHALDLKLEQSRGLLDERTRTVAEVAIETGFHDESHLIRHFKKRYGLTPTAYRSR